MKLLLIAYNEALESDVKEMFAACGVEGFTQWTRVLGQGRASGPHLGTGVWPKANHVMMVAAPPDQAARLIRAVKALRQTSAHEGIKAFVLPLEEVT
jgi:nitrogen regulatory protein PII